MTDGAECDKGLYGKRGLAKLGARGSAIRSLLAFTLTLLSSFSANADDLDRFYKVGEDAICGPAETTCRHEACGVDPNYDSLFATCRRTGQFSQGTCTSINPLEVIRDDAIYRGIELGSVERATKVESSGGTCKWHSQMVSTGNFYNEDYDACFGAVDISGEPLGAEVPCEEEQNHCNINYAVYSSCPSTTACDFTPTSCRSIIFGVDPDAALSIDQTDPTEKLYVNVIDVIFQNYRKSLIDKDTAIARSKEAESVFNDYNSLLVIYEDEVARND